MKVSRVSSQKGIQPSPGLVEMALLLVLLWGLQLSIGTATALLGGLKGSNSAWWAALAAVVAFAPVLLLARGMARRSGVRWSWKGTMDHRLWWAVGLLLSAAGGSVVLGALSSALGLLWPMSGLQQLLSQLAPSTFSMSALVLFGVVAPVTEETLFRGYFLTGATQRYGRLPAVFLTAALFGVAHGNPWQGLPALVAGFYLAGVVPRGGLASAVVAHAVFNIFPLLLRWAGVVIPGVNDFAAVIPPWRWLLGGFLVLGAGIAITVGLTLMPYRGDFSAKFTNDSRQPG